VRSLPLADTYSDADVERRKRGRRASDLDGAYNDDKMPTPVGVSSGIAFYTGLIWIVATSAIGTLYVLRSAWDAMAVYFPHG
jgi:hypothetical protein